MNVLSIGSLFSGYGGLERGVQEVLGGTVAWHSEIDPGACKILARRYPDVPNLGDIERVGLPFSDEEWAEIKAAQKAQHIQVEIHGGDEYEMPVPDWSGVEPVDVLTGGFPCQDVSAAGKREGIRPGTRSGLWGRFLDAIEQLNPSLVVIENVRGLLSANAHHPAHSELEPCPWELGDRSGPTLRALGAVLGDLADIGFDAEWVGLRAADVGAPHGRFRVFVVAWPAADADRGGWSGWDCVRGWKSDVAGIAGVRGAIAPPHPANDGRERGRPSRVWRDGSADHRDAAADARGWELQRRGVGGVLGGASAEESGEGYERERAGDAARDGRTDVAWGDYELAIRRWERVLGRPAPAPSELGAKGNVRLSPAFVEWLMGLPAGWVTDVPGLSRNEMLKALGNGVVPQQAAQALRMLLPDVTRAAA